MNITTDNSITSVNGVYESNGVTNSVSNGANKVNADDTAAILTLSRNGDSDGVVNVKRTSSNFNLYASDINNVQSILRTMGYYNGPNCGFVSDETRTAIRKFQKDYGMAETGSLTENVYDAILAVSDLKKNTGTQQKLTTLGFYDGNIKHIYISLKNFQKLYGISNVGKYDDETKKMLDKVYDDYKCLYNSDTMAKISNDLCHYDIENNIKIPDDEQKDAFVKVYVFLKNGMGLNTHQIAGVMGNLHAESAILPDNVENRVVDREHNRGQYTYKTGDDVGFGLLQWTNFIRKENLYEMAKSMAFSNGDTDIENALWDINVQLAYFKKEMTTELNLLDDYKSSWEKIESAKTYNEVSDIFLKEIEQPISWASQITVRRGLSKKIYDLLIEL